MEAFCLIMVPVGGYPKPAKGQHMMVGGMLAYLKHNRPDLSDVIDVCG